MTLYDPSSYGFLDRFAWNELFPFRSKAKGNFTVSECVEYLAKVREIARLHQLNVRDVDKALYQRHKTRL